MGGPLLGSALLPLLLSGNAAVASAASAGADSSSSFPDPLRLFLLGDAAPFFRKEKGNGWSLVVAMAAHFSSPVFPSPRLTPLILQEGQRMDRVALAQFSTVALLCTLHL